MLHTPVRRFEPSRCVSADRLIRHHERRKWQPIRVSRNDARGGMRALHLGRRLQRGSGRSLTPSCETGWWSLQRERSRAAQNGRCVPEGVDGQPLGTHRAAAASQASDRPVQGWGGLVPSCCSGHSRGQIGGPLVSPRGIYTVGLGTARARPVRHAIRRPGCVAQLGRLRWPALAHLLTSGSSVCRAPSVPRRGCHGLALSGWGALRFSAHGGRGNGVGLIAIWESGARLVYSRLTLGRAG